MHLLNRCINCNSVINEEHLKKENSMKKERKLWKLVEKRFQNEIENNFFKLYLFFNHFSEHINVRIWWKMFNQKFYTVEYFVENSV